MVAAVSNDDVALGVKADATLARELARAAALAAQGSHKRTVAQAKHLDAAVDVGVMNEYVAVPIDGDSTWLVQLPLPAAFAADGPDGAAVCVAKNLDAVVA